MKLPSKWALFALVLAAAFVLAPLGAAQAKGTENPLKNIAVTGSGPDGVFKGNFDITSFTVENDTLYAVGNLKGQLTGAAGKSKVNLTNVKWAVEAINGKSLSGLTATTGTTSSLFAAQQQAACTILSLELGPLDLTLLGLRVQLSPVDLLITAIPGAGLLGDLLCAVTNLLNSGLTGILGQLANLLNQILAILNQL